METSNANFKCKFKMKTLNANLKGKFKGANWKGNSAWGIKGTWRQFEKANLNGNFQW